MSRPLGELVRFCNNPSCELCDVHIKPREVLVKGETEVCPQCLEPLVVRRLRPRPPTRPSKPGTHPVPQGNIPRRP
ncbi:MAG: hypothetical protein ACE5JD_09205 [Candidatus Methylomirabilia bacterium]